MRGSPAPSPLPPQENLARGPQEPAKVQPLEKPMFIEICAGSALLSSVAREAGFDILPIDAGRKVPRAYAHVLRLDLREALTLQFLHNVLRNRTVAWMHFSLPTGTIGRVFRSSAAPLGLPNLQEPLASQVVAANKILDQVAALLQSVAISFPTVGVSVEHPLGSVVWELPAFARLRGSLSHVSVTACFFGAPYNRKTLLVSNRNIFQSMGGGCPGCAHHCKPPGSGFRVDGSYPKAFCEAFVGHVSADCPGRGLFLAPQAVSTLHASRAAAQAQPRATKFPPLISEFAYTVTVRAAQAPLLRSSVPGGVNSPHQPVPGLADASLASFTFGVYREPSTFLREAKLLRHPFDTCRGLPDGMLKVLHFVLVQGPVGVMRHRLNVLKLWQKWATELAGEEEKLRASLHPDVRAVLGNKRVLLMKKIASSLQWPDTTLWDDLTSGFKLTGSQPRDATWNRVDAAPPQEYSKPLWDITLEEVCSVAGEVALDEVAWVCMYIMKACKFTGSVDLELSDGTRSAMLVEALGSIISSGQAGWLSRMFVGSNIAGPSLPPPVNPRSLFSLMERASQLQAEAILPPSEVTDELVSKWASEKRGAWIVHLGIRYRSLLA
ncbi:unnamed protein product [Symbiodinium sp. CCMP2456]|nr:unnamed protein product [Symbiodinium sp. CCMP2456]